MNCTDGIFVSSVDSIIAGLSEKDATKVGGKQRWNFLEIWERLLRKSWKPRTEKGLPPP
jgi:hypothetical protein